MGKLDAGQELTVADLKEVHDMHITMRNGIFLWLHMKVLKN